mmetsp:Transcript_16831/g.40397  ORF Transcript_16831/g.40397 Transcript_16831/m.40397 type:complete len:221 (+) Transcript_16831:80-742(+)
MTGLSEVALGDDGSAAAGGRWAITSTSSERGCRMAGARMQTALNPLAMSAYAPHPTRGASKESFCLPKKFRDVRTSTPPRNSPYLSRAGSRSPFRGTSCPDITSLDSRIAPAHVPQTGFLSAWTNCFRASIMAPLSACAMIRRVVDSPPGITRALHELSSEGVRTCTTLTFGLCSLSKSFWCSSKAPWRANTPSTTAVRAGEAGGLSGLHAGDSDASTIF